MKEKTILLTFLLSLLLVTAFYFLNESAWSVKERESQFVRQIIGLPSIAVGNLSPAARVPGLENMCTAFYDVPGGYCHYFSSGIPNHWQATEILK